MKHLQRDELAEQIIELAHRASESEQNSVASCLHGVASAIYGNCDSALAWQVNSFCMDQLKSTIRKYVSVSGYLQ